MRYFFIRAILLTTVCISVLLAAGCKKKSDPLAQFNIQRMNGVHYWKFQRDFTTEGYSYLMYAVYHYTSTPPAHDTTIYGNDTFGITVANDMVIVNDMVIGIACTGNNDSFVYFSNKTLQGGHDYSDITYNCQLNTIEIYEGIYNTRQLLFTTKYTTP
jgi:hypothetical protein